MEDPASLGDSSEYTSTVEFWIDARGIVWRIQAETLVGGTVFWSVETILFDVGADIVIEAPPVEQEP